MDLKYLADYISIQQPAAWERCGQAAMEAYRPDWLDELDFESILDYYGFSEEYYKPRLLQEVALLKEDETLNRACWLMHYVLFYGASKDFTSIWSWGKGSKAFSEHGSLVTCVVAQLSGQPIHAANMEVRGYDQEQIEFHKKGVRACWVGQHTTFKKDGISFGIMVWGAYFMRCHLVSLGRLQYEHGLKHFDRFDDRFEGEPGYIFIHIPRSDNGLRDEDVEASIRLAEERLEQYFPDLAGKTKVFCTHTWLLSPELREILKPTSNIVRFQNRFNIVEYDEGVGPFLGFGFNVQNSPELDYSTLPEDSSLRRELKARLMRGEPLHSGWGYFTL